MTQETKGRTRRWTRILLIGSVALNVLIIGVVGGAAIAIKGDGDRPAPTDRFGAAHIKALSFEDKRAVGRAIRKAYRSAEIDHHADQANYKEALAVLRSTPFDETAMVELVTRLDMASEQRRELARDVFLAQILSMTDAERAAYADRLEEVLERGPRGKDGRPPKNGKPRPPKQP